MPNGLVPIEYLGKELEVNTSNITTIINLANSALDRDFREEGRKINYAELQKNS